MRKFTSRLTLGLVALTVAASAAAIEPGNWEATTRATDIQLSSEIPPQVADMMRDAMGNRTFSNTSCVTREDLDSAPERMFQETDGECRYTEFDMTGGTLRGVAECNTDQGTMTMTMDGTYTDTSYDMTMTMSGDVGMGPMSMTYEVTGRRLGACS